MYSTVLAQDRKRATTKKKTRATIEVVAVFV